MSPASMEDLVLVHFATRASAEHSQGDSTHSLPDIADSLGVDTLSDRLELASTLESLSDDGVLEVESGGGADRSETDGAPTYALTPGGLDRAETVRDELTEMTIDLVGEEQFKRELGTVATELDATVVEIASDLTEDGAYYLDTEPREGFVDRERERTTCNDCLDRLEDGNGQAVMITGPPGVGKTTLAEHVTDRVRERGLTVARGNCRNAQTAPYQPLRDALADRNGNRNDDRPGHGNRNDDRPGHGNRNEDGHGDEKRDETGSASADEEPSVFANLDPVVEEAGTLDAQQAALFDDLTEELTPGDEEPPRVLFLDDLHSADSTTIRYLEALLERIGTQRLALLATYRSAEVDDDTPFEEIPEDAPIEIVDVAPFDREATGELIERVLERRDIPESLVSAVHEWTGGNPLFVEETVTSLVESGELDPDLEWYPTSVDEITVPGEVEATIDGRIDRLTDEVRDLLEWGSVIGSHVPIDVLEAVSDLPESEFRTYLDLFANGTIWEYESEGAAVQFRSDVVRDALLEELEVEDRRERHAAVAAALEAQQRETDDAENHTDDHAAAIAHHYEAAGKTESAIEWYRRAGGNAEAVYAHEVAVDHYHEALELARRTDDTETVLDIAEELVEIHITVGEFDRAERHAEFVRERASDTDRRQRMLFRSGWIANERGKYETAREFVGEGLALDDDPSPVVCQLLHVDAWALLQLAELDEALETAQRQLETAETVGDRSLVAKAHRNLGTIKSTRGEDAVAKDHFEQSLSIERDAGNDYDVAKVQVNLAIIYNREGDTERAARDYRDAYETFQEIGDELNATNCRLNLGTIWLSDGQYGSAAECFREGQATYERLGDRHSVAMTTQSLGYIAVRQEEYELARDRFENALDIYEEASDTLGVAGAHLVLADLERRTGNYERARDHAETSLEKYREIDQQTNVAWATLTLGAIARDQRRLDEAREYVENGFDLADQEGDEEVIAIARINLGLLALLEGDRSAASDAIEDGMTTLEELDEIDTALEEAREIVETTAAAEAPQLVREWSEWALEILHRDAVEPFDEQVAFFENYLDDHE